MEVVVVVVLLLVLAQVYEEGVLFSPAIRIVNNIVIISRLLLARLRLHQF